MLVAIATAAVAWLLWTRADDRSREQDDRAAQTVNEALQNSVGRVLTSLRAAAGLVNANGEVDRASFQSYARALGSIGASDGLALAEIVPAAERARFESATGRRISELARPGTLRAAGRRDLYVPIVSVWPEDGSKTALLGFDLSSELRSPGGDRSRSDDAAHDVHRGHPVRPGGPRLPGVPADLPARREHGAAPVAYVTTWFSRSVIDAVLSRLPPDVRARVTVGGRRGVCVEGRTVGRRHAHASARRPAVARDGARRARLALVLAGDPRRRRDPGSHARGVHVGSTLLRTSARPRARGRARGSRALGAARADGRASRRRGDSPQRWRSRRSPTSSPPASTSRRSTSDAPTCEETARRGRRPRGLYCADRIAARGMGTGRTIEIATSDEIRARYWPEQAPPTRTRVPARRAGARSRREVAGALVAGSRQTGVARAGDAPRRRRRRGAVRRRVGACAAPLGRRRGAASCRHPAAARCEPLPRPPFPPRSPRRASRTSSRRSTPTSRPSASRRATTCARSRFPVGLHPDALAVEARAALDLDPDGRRDAGASHDRAARARAGPRGLSPRARAAACRRRLDGRRPLPARHGRRRRGVSRGPAADPRASGGCSTRSPRS